MSNDVEDMHMKTRVTALHRFLTVHLFYPLLLSSGLACAILAGRVIRFERFSFIFLLWNLLLAWMPYLWSLWAASIQRRHPQDWWRLLIPGALWLLFFPNAPYLVTDFLHLRARPAVPLWYDLGLLAAFAWSGFFLAVASLHTMQTLVRRIFGSLMSWLFVLGVVGLSGLGVYLGRFQGWNSWDLLLSPRAVLADAVRPLLYPLSSAHTLSASGMFAALLLACYVMFVAAYQGGRAGALAADEDAPSGHRI
jgi:uncharacterized membrane protein